MGRARHTNQSEDGEVLTGAGGTPEFWRYVQIGACAPLVLVLFLWTVRRKRHTRAALAGAQCGSAASLLACGIIATLALLLLETPDVPHGIAVVPIILSGVFSPPLLFFGTYTFLTLHGRHRRSSLHIVLSVGAAALCAAMILFVVIYTFLNGMWTAM